MHTVGSLVGKYQMTVGGFWSHMIGGGAGELATDAMSILSGGSCRGEKEVKLILGGPALISALRGSLSVPCKCFL